MSYEVYIGPYLEIKDKVIESKVIRSVTCLEHTKEKGQFCSICGSKKEEREITVSQKVSLFDIIKDDLYQINFNNADNLHSLWLANTYEIGYEIGRELYNKSEVVLPLTTKWQETQMSLFKKWCSKVSKQLDEQNFKYEICFGIISYWS